MSIPRRRVRLIFCRKLSAISHLSDGFAHVACFVCRICFIEKGSADSQGLLGSLLSLVYAVLDLLSALLKLILGSNSSGDLSTADSVAKVVLTSIQTILSSLLGPLGDLPVLGSILETLEDVLTSIVENVITTLGSVGSLLGGPGLSELVTGIVNAVVGSLDNAVGPLLDGILPEGSDCRTSE